MVKIVNFWKKLPELKQSKCDSYNIVKDVVDDPLIVVKLEFFIYVAGLLEPYLKSYQSDQPMVPFMYFDLKKLVTCLLKLFVKAEVIDNCKTFDLANIDLDKKSNFHEPDNMTLGFASEKTLKDLKKDDVIEDSDAKQFRLDCRTLTQMMTKLFERSPLKQAVVRYCRIFDPKTITSYLKEATKKAL